MCFSCAENTISTDEPTEKGWVKPELEGQWKFVSAIKVEDTRFLNHYPNPYAPAYEAGPPEPPYIGPDLIFENDSLYEVFYPRLLVDRTLFSIDSGYLHFLYEWNTESHPVELVNDTLFIYKPFHEKVYIKEGYVKTTFNDSIVDLLKKYEVNYAELAGTWYLVRESSGDDGTYYELDFPYNIPDSIEISRELFIREQYQNKVFMMSTDGKMREYTFLHMWGNLKLTPGEWYKGEDPWIHFSR